MRRTSLRFVFGAMIVVAAMSPAAQAAELKGKFVLAGKGEVPKADPIVDAKAFADFSKLQLVDESLVVDPGTGGIANIAVYVRTANAPITEAAVDAAAPRAVIDTWYGQFRPRVSGVWVGRQRFIVQNQDPIAHNPNMAHAGISPLLAPAEEFLEVPIAVPALIPKEICCSIHPWMKGFVMVRDNPYFTATAADGSFTLKHLPKGVALEIQVWHEKSGYLNADPKWAKGRFTVKLDTDQDLGTIPVPRTLFGLPEPKEEEARTIIMR
jgi:hypothetical protein